jgi:hypothetical protein
MNEENIENNRQLPSADVGVNVMIHDRILKLTARHNMRQAFHQVGIEWSIADKA